jgi:hypothetical protein
LPAQQPLQRLWKQFRELGHARGGDANSAPQKRTVKKTLCAAREEYVCKVHAHTHTCILSYMC